MATQWNSQLIKFEGGLITNLGRLEQGIQAPGSATMLRNFEPSVQKGYSKILGYEKFSAEPIPNTGQVFSAIMLSQAKALVMRNSVYYVSQGSDWTRKVTAPNLGATKVRHDHYNFNGNEMVVLVDGLNRPAYYNVTNDTMGFDSGAPTDVVGASIVKVFKGSLFFSKGPLLSFTAPYADQDYATGNGAGVINVGTEITGLTVFRDQLIIFGVDKIFYLAGNTSEDFELQPIADKTGCLSHESIQEVGGDILYLGPDGIRYLSATQKNNDFGLERASVNIQNDMTKFAKNNSIFASTVIRAKSQYRIFTFTSSLPRRVSQGWLATRYADQTASNIQWGQVVGMKVYSCDSRQFDRQEIIVFSSDDDYLYKMENGNSFDGEAIDCLFETPFMPITDPRKRKTVYKHSLYASMNGKFTLTCSVKLDYRASGIIQPPSFLIGANEGGGAIFGDGISKFGTSVFSSPVRDQFVNNIVGSGLTFSLRYEDSSTNPSYNLDYVILEFRENERR